MSTNPADEVATVPNRSSRWTGLYRLCVVALLAYIAYCGWVAVRAIDAMGLTDPIPMPIVRVVNPYRFDDAAARETPLKVEVVNTVTARADLNDQPVKVWGTVDVWADWDKPLWIRQVE